MILQFSTSKICKVSMTSYFNVWQGHSESLREYLARFNEDTIKVSHLNQDIFVGAFHNGLKAEHFNESFPKKPIMFMEEIMSMVEFFIKLEESNAKKRVWDAKERGGIK